MNALVSPSPDDRLAMARARHEQAVAFGSGAPPKFPISVVGDENSFFKRSLDYLQTMTDAPQEFLYSSLLMLASGVIGNRVHMQVGSQKVKPNLYGICLAGSTVGRKSTSISFCGKYLDRLQDRLNSEGVKFRMPDSGSLEGLMESMREPRLLSQYGSKEADKVQSRQVEQKEIMNSGIACFSEFAGFLDNMRKDYNKGMESFVIDVYDGNNHKRQLKNELSLIVDPCLSIFGASTMTQFLQRITENDKHSGFLQRMFYCYVPEQRQALRSLIEISQPDEAAEEMLMSALERIYRIARNLHADGRGIACTQEAKTMYSEAFMMEQQLIAEIRQTDPDYAGVLMGFHGRLDMMKFKIAMIFAVVEAAEQDCLADADKPIRISGSVMSRAVQLTSYFWHTTGYLLANQFKFSAFEIKLSRVRALLQQHAGTLPRRLLLQKTGWTAKEFDEIVETGIQSGVLIVLEERKRSGQTAKHITLIN